jgi:arginase
MAKYVSLLGAPCGLGGRDQGTNRGPETIVAAGLQEYLQSRGHVVRYQDLKEWTLGGGTGDASMWDSDEVSEENPKHAKKIAAVNGIIAAHAFKAHHLGGIPVVLGGDHSVVIGSISQALAKYKEQLGLIWFDAHFDVHTPETSHSHNANGMPLATVMGYGHPELLSLVPRPYLQAKHVLHIGGGNLFCEEEELTFLREQGIRTFPASLIRKRIRFLCEQLQLFIDAHEAIYVTCDMDFVHRRSAPGVDYVSHNGVPLSCGCHISKNIGQSGKIIGIDMVEYKPSADRRNKQGQLITATSIMTLLGALLGSQK